MQRPERGGMISSGEKTEVVAIQKDYEVRIPRTTVLLVPWLRQRQEGDSPDHVECIAVLGAAGGIQIDRIDGPIGQWREAIAVQLARREVTSAEAGENWMDVVRFFNSSRRLTMPFHAATETRRFTIPSYFRRLRVLPNRVGDRVVLHVQNNILEVWPVPDWVSHLLEVHRDLAGLYPESHETLEERGEEEDFR